MWNWGLFAGFGICIIRGIHRYSIPDFDAVLGLHARGRSVSAQVKVVQLPVDLSSPSRITTRRRLRGGMPELVWAVLR